MITQEQYEKAVKQVEEGEAVIRQYFVEKDQRFREREKTNPVYTDEELVYAAHSRCKCGAGLAYVKGCPANHYWDCSAILKGKGVGGVDGGGEHSSPKPFAFWKITSELEFNEGEGITTRPKPENQGK